MGYKTFGCDTGGFPFYLFKDLIEKYDVPFFVETGSASGDSARIAATMFKEVWTIELLEAAGESTDTVHFLEGDSAEFLPEIISEIKEKGLKNQRTIFYLDAHYCGDTPNKTDYPECPVLMEIEIAAEMGEDAIIVIDDARLFLGQPPYPHNPQEWPSVMEIFLLLKEKFPYHHITITDDYILAIPLHVRDVIDEEWRRRFKIRYPDEDAILKEQVRGAYKALLKYIE